MQFLINAYDYKDEDAQIRRLEIRPKHLELVAKFKEEGHFHFGGAILDENNKMIGSAMVMEFPTHDGINAWLEIEPYVVGNVWEKVDVKPFKIASSKN